MRLLEKTLEKGVSFFPGQFFYVNQPDANGIRLNFTFPPKEKIRLGIQKLAQAYRQLKQEV
jgi:2-aminoadipate transaminase